MDKAPRTLDTLLPLEINKRVEKSYKVESKPVKLILSRKEQGPYSIQVIVTGKKMYTPLFSDGINDIRELNERWRRCLENIKARS
ncbi:MAG TPA: hypothetical protein VI758_03695 [Bacteroidota bacterium]